MPGQYDVMDYMRRSNIFSGNRTVQPRPLYTPPTFGGSIVDDDEDPVTKRRRALGLDTARSTSNSDTGTEDTNNSGINRTMDEYSKLMSAPPGPAQSKYRNFLDQQEPKREDFKSTKTQKLASILAGVSEGIRKGGFAGYSAANSVLDQPYEEAKSNYKLQASKLAESANLEEKDINNRIKTYRDILQDEASRRTADRQNRLTDKQIENYNSEIAARNDEKGTKGWTRGEDKLTGEVIYTRVDPKAKGGIATVRGVKTDQTPQEKYDEDIKKSRTISGITLDREKKLNDYTRPQKTADEIAKETRAEARQAERDQRTAERTANTANTPNREFQNRALAFQKIREEHPELAKSIKVDPVTNAITSSDPAVLKMVEEAVKNAKVVAPKASTAKTDTGKATSNTDTTMIKMIDKDGKEWDVKPANIDAAIRSGLKRK